MFDSSSSLSEFHQSSQKIKNAFKKHFSVAHRDPSQLDSLTTDSIFLLREVYL